MQSSYWVRDHTLALLACHADSLLLPLLLLLADLNELTGTSQPTLGVLFFPLNPLSRKGATHMIPENASTKLASQGRATTR